MIHNSKMYKRAINHLNGIICIILRWKHLRKSKKGVNLKNHCACFYLKIYQIVLKVAEEFWKNHHAQFCLDYTR